MMATQFPAKRRSMLGRRHLKNAQLSNSGETSPVSRPTLALPTPGRGLHGRRNAVDHLNKSSKKAQKSLLFANDRFAKTPQEPTFTINKPHFNYTSPKYFNSSTESSSSLGGNSMNITGVQLLTSPESSVNNKLTTSYRFTDKLEPPKSPGVSYYDKWLQQKLNSIKAPIDPDDVVNDIKTLNINSDKLPQDLQFRPRAFKRDATSYHSKIKVSPLFPSKITKTSPHLSTSSYNPFESKFSPHLSSTYVDKLDDNIGNDCIETKPKSDCPSVSSSKKLSIINENKESFDEEKETNETLKEDDLNSTDSFVYTEQTIIDQDEVFKVPTAKKAPKNITKVSEKHEDEEQLILKLINKVDQSMKELSEIKPILQQLLEKKTSRKNGSNKENCPVTTSKKEKKWINDLKTDNPNLLKTPKTNRASVVNRLTYTPHSLAGVLQDQVDDLFDD